MERKLIAAAVSSALALPMAAQAVEFSVSGHVNRAIISVDGGGMDYDGDLQHVDANSSQTRFRFTGSEEMDSGMTAGVQLEYGLTTNVRHANAYLSSDGGKLTVGHGSRATDGMAHADLGGPAWLGGATNWCSYHSTGPACPSNDGGRGPMLRYDTPAIGPAGVAVSTGNDDYWDVMLKAAGSFGDAGYDVRVGYIAEHDADVDEVPLSVTAVRAGDLRAALEKAEESVEEHFMAPDFSLQDAKGKAIDDKGLTTAYANELVYKHQAKKAATTEPTGDVTTASAAFSFGQGTSVAVAWSQDNTADNEYQYIKLDHSYGDGSIGVYYKNGETDDTNGSHMGVAIGHSLGGGATAYAGFRQMSEDNKDDVDLMVAGLRVTFN